MVIFQYSHNKADWEVAFVQLLLIHGPPDPGIKWYGVAQRVQFTNLSANIYIRGVVKSIHDSIEASGVLDHCTPRYRVMRGLHMKNVFLEWCRSGKFNVKNTEDG